MEGSANADHGPVQKSTRPETQIIHENLPRMRSQKRGIRRKMQKMPQQKPPLEEKRNRKVRRFHKVFLENHRYPEEIRKRREWLSCCND
jgi:hypothetical protein